MNKSQRIRLNPNNPNEDKYLKIKLEQNVDKLEFLTLKLNTRDVYETTNSDFGILVGRVIANDGVGIPNAKISIFIPLDEEDESNGEIRGLYPYKTPRDKNFDGKRYNLLPRVGEFDHETRSYKPRQPFGSFPTKPELITNKTLMGVYKKYYKYSTITNEFGDYMIFGAPVGVFDVHLSVDITDIGEYSMTPPVMIKQLGYSENLFIENGTKIIPSSDLDDLPNIETQEISVDIRPFWGNADDFEIGITRQDFRIRAQLVNTFTVFGTSFTDGEESTWGSSHDEYLIRRLYRLSGDFITIDGDGKVVEGDNDGSVHDNFSITSKRIGRISENIFYIPNTVSDETIKNNELDPNGNDFSLMDNTEYSSFKKDGDFVYIIPCNRKKIIINEFGDLVEVPPDEPRGVFIEFKGYMTFDYDDSGLDISLEQSIRSITLNNARPKVKIPQVADRNETFKIFGYPAEEPTLGNRTTEPDEEIGIELTSIWRNQFKTFEGGEFYTVSKFHPTIRNGGGNAAQTYDDGFLGADIINDLTLTPDPVNPFRTVGLIGTRGFVSSVDSDGNTIIQHRTADFPNNATQVNYFAPIVFDEPVFGSNWLNFALYLPQYVHSNPQGLHPSMFNVKSSTYFTHDIRRIFRYLPPGLTDPVTLYQPLVAGLDYYLPNTQLLGGGVVDTSRFLRSDIHWTDFVKVSREDLSEIIKKIESEDGLKKGFTSLNVDLSSDFRNGMFTTSDEDDLFFGKDPCPFNGGKILGVPSNDPDDLTYFFRGHSGADCIMYLKKLGFI